MSRAAGRALIVFTALTAAGSVGAGEPGAVAIRAVAIRSAIDLGGLDTRSAALMLSAQDAGDLEVSVLAIPLPDPLETGELRSERSRVTLVVDVGGTSLLEGVSSPSEESELITELYAYALDAESGLIDSLTQAFRLDLERDRSRLSARGMKFFGSLELPVGDYSLRVLVLHRRSGRLGLRILPLEVPSWGQDPVLVPPFRREPPAGWILVHAAEETPAGPATIGTATIGPVAIGEQTWVPSARQGLDAGARADYLVVGHGLDRGLRAHLLDTGGEPLAEVDLGDPRPATGGPAGLETLAAELDATGLEAGEYRLRISTAGDPPVSASSAPLLVRPADDALSDQAAALAGISARGSRGRQAEFERLEEVRGGYRQALGLLAAGDRAGALEPLIEIESARIGAGSVEEQTRLARAELQIARELAGPRPEVLLRVIWIHEALYRRYHRRRSYMLATHSRQVVSRLAELYLERDSSKHARRLVACALVSLGGYLQATGSSPAAEIVYHDALARDPDHPAALIGLAVVQESYGQYQTAADLLLRLHRLRPADTQTRLRLGVNLRRLDKTRRAANHLRSALSEPGPDWVAAVAAQELASLHAAEKRLDEAMRVLEEAIARHPEVQRLRIQLAALLDRAGAGAEALAALDRLDPQAGSDTSSPRLIYSRAPATAITAARHALSEEVGGPPAPATASPGHRTPVLPGGGP